MGLLDKLSGLDVAKVGEQVDGLVNALKDTAANTSAINMRLAAIDQAQAAFHQGLVVLNGNIQALHAQVGALAGEVMRLRDRVAPPALRAPDDDPAPVVGAVHHVNGDG